LTHDICEHPAHHVLPAIPCYRLRAAQQRLAELIGPRSLEVPLAWGPLAEIMRRCKVYDSSSSAGSISATGRRLFPALPPRRSAPRLDCPKGIAPKTPSGDTFVAMATPTIEGRSDGVGM